MGEAKRKRKAKKAAATVDAPAPLRLALRVEGPWWVAYMAETGTMEGAIELGRILVNGVRTIPQGAEAWKTLMVAIMGACLQAEGLTPTSWEVQTAPESERAGSA